MSPLPTTQPLSEARKLYETLRKVDFLDQLKMDQMEALLGAMRKRRYGAGETVFKQGSPADALYLVASGQLGMRSRRALLSREVAELGPGQYFGERSLLDSEPHQTTVTAKSVCELYILHKAEFEQILLGNPGIKAALRAHKAVVQDQIRRA